MKLWSSTKIWSKSRDFIRNVYDQFFLDNCPMRAASLAYTSLLSVVPLMAVSFTVMTAFPMFRQFGQQIQTFIFQNFVAASAQVVQANIQKFTVQAMNLSATGLIFLVITALLMIYNMERAFNVIWRAKEPRLRLNAFMLYWGLLTFVPILLGVGFAMSSYIFSLPVIEGTTQYLGLEGPLLLFAPYLLTFIAFTVLYITLPNCKVRFKHAMAGGFVATILFEFAKFGFGLYVVHFSTYELLYGTLATIPIFLIWVYLSWLIILFGAVVAHVADGKGQLKRHPAARSQDA